MHNGVRKAISWGLFVVFVVILVFSIALFAPAMKHRNEVEKQLNSLKEELRQKRNEEIRLAREVHDLEHNATASERVAREKFKLCREGEIIIRYDSAPQK